MKILNIKNNPLFLKEYFSICSKEWGTKKNKEELKIYINNKINNIKTNDKIISILGLIHEEELIGFISLFKHDGDYKQELTPWYATMYVKPVHRKKGYSKLLSDAILKEAKNLGYSKIYLKTNLLNYYEKFGAKYIEKLPNNENLYYIET